MDWYNFYLFVVKKHLIWREKKQNDLKDEEKWLEKATNFDDGFSLE